ncbi:MAG: class I SAM-dependent methyltransferase [Termitinemataceae bacterium]
MDDIKKDEWFQDEDFWDRFAPIMFDEQRWAEVSTVADGIEALYQHLAKVPEPVPAVDPIQGSKRQGMAILDQCCGLGRLSVELAIRGHRLTGIDITSSYLEAARESARDEEVAIEFIQSDVRDFVRPVSFDLVLNLYTSFGYFSDPMDDRQVLANAYHSLVPGGVYILETLGKEIAVRDFIEGEWFERAGAVVLTEYTPLDDWEYLYNRWILLKNGERFERSFKQRLYAATELRKLFMEVGFSSVAVFGSWDMKPYDRYAQQLIVVGRR